MNINDATQFVTLHKTLDPHPLKAVMSFMDDPESKQKMQDVLSFIVHANVNVSLFKNNDC